MKAILLPITLGLSLLCAITTPAQVIRKIKGHILIGPSTPLAGATIYLLRPTDSTAVKHTVIDSQGRFVFRRVKESDYLLCIRATGMAGYYSAIFDTTDKDHIEMALHNLHFHKDTAVVIQ